MQRTVTLLFHKASPVVAVILLALLAAYAVFIHTVAGLSYSAGTYGTCTYDTCSISLTTSGSISEDITPVGGSTTCTVSSDTVSASTGSSTGYTITLNNTDTSSALTGPASIPTSTATPASPSILTTNTWGYRVDSIAGFGVGPTSAIANGSIPSLTFAGIPISSDTPALIRTTSTADTGTINTSVWYGVCANSSLQSGSYSDGVTYTAVIN